MIRGLIFCVLLVGCQSTLELNDKTMTQMLYSPENEYRNEYITIRSFREKDGKRIEVAGAKCGGDTGWIRFSRLTTPGQVEIPSYLRAERFKVEGKPPSMTVTCRLDSERIQLVLDPSSSVGSTTVYGSTTTMTDGSSATTQVISLTGRLSSTLPWRYSNVAVEFKE